jgi:S-methylmethionine-dependent homocysteine/selenocysteine methylase
LFKVQILCLNLWHLQQATLQGFEARGLTQAEGEALLQKSVTIACEERDRFWDQYINRLQLGLAESGMYRRALIAASIGSYGAFLADGSEYRQVSSTGRLKCTALNCVFSSPGPFLPL